MSEKTSDECEEAIRRFADVTKCDEAFAHSILQDYNYDVDFALSKFFSNEDTFNENSDEDVVENDINVLPTHDRRPEDDFLPKELTFVSWNIDGIDTVNLQKRFVAVLHIIAKANPEVIFLQEVVGDVMPKLMDVLTPMYHIFISDPNFPYFCVTLVSKNIRIINEEVVQFSNTAMGRGMIVVEAEWKKMKLKLINTHLESMGEYSEQRKQQFKQCMTKLDEIRSHCSISETLAIFAGDLNIRDSEVPLLPPNIKDAWLEGGAKQDLRYTWDLRRNDNKQGGGARLRFDRVYYSGPFQRVDFSLAGTQRIRGIHCFPSDHFAVICRFHSASSGL